MLRLLAKLMLLCAVATANPCSSPDVVDLGILVEGSSSFEKSEYILTKRFLVSLVQLLDVSTTKTHVGIGYYTKVPQLHAELRDNRLYDPIKLMLSILSLKFPGGEAKTDLALKMVNDELFSVNKGDRPNVPNVLIFITHGRPGPKNAAYKEALEQIKARGTRVIVVGLGEGVPDDDLLQIALGKEEQVFHVKKIEQLNPEKLSTLIKNSC